MFSFIFGVAVGALGVLVWNRVNPRAVDRFIEKHEREIRERLGLGKAE